MARLRRTAAWLALAGGVAACGSEGGGDAGAGAVCLDAVVTDCQPLYEPTFANLHDRLFVPKCALAGGACHAPEGAQGGLVLAGDADTVFAALTADVRWLQSDTPRCGAIIERVGTADAQRVMPPGSPLADAERCALAQWVSAGAPR